MKQKLATLEVWIDDETEEPSAMRSNPELRRYKLTMNPKEDLNLMPDQKLTRKSFATILAHELGHFVAQIVMSPWQTVLGLIDKVPGETEAWALAHKIYPDLDTSMEEKALATYIKAPCGHERCSNRPPKEIQDMLWQKFDETRVA